VEASRRFCLNLVKNHYENFPVMISLFRREVREALAAVYAFARTADDFVDEPQFEPLREALLDQWEAQLGECFRGRSVHPVFIALEEAVRMFSLEPQPFRDLLSAFRQDCRQNRYQTFGEVLDYCRRSANPVGRIVLKILGIDHRELWAWSDDICTALQLTNFLQDLSVDLGRNRLYLPVEDLEVLKIRTGSLLSGRPDDACGELIRMEANRARELFRHGRPLLERTGFPERLYFTAVWLGGRTILRMVRDLGAGVLLRRPCFRAGSAVLLWLKVGPEKIARYAGRGGWIH
jgi:squalene synthase HpnC